MNRDTAREVAGQGRLLQDLEEELCLPIRVASAPLNPNVWASDRLAKREAFRFPVGDLKFLPCSTWVGPLTWGEVVPDGGAPHGSAPLEKNGDQRH